MNGNLSKLIWDRCSTEMFVDRYTVDEATWSGVSYLYDSSAEETVMVQRRKWRPQQAPWNTGRLDHPLHPSPSPAVSTLVCHWTKMFADRTVRSATRNPFSLKSNLWRKSLCVFHSISSYLASYKKESAPAVPTKKRFKDSLKAALKTFTIDHDSWEVEEQDRCGWRASVYEGAKRCETSRP